MQTQPKFIEFRQKRTFDQVLNTTFVFLKHNFKKFFQSFFAIGGPVILLTGVFYGVFFYGFMKNAFTGMEPGSDPFEIFGFGAFGPVVFVLLALIIMVGYILLTGAVYEFMALYKEQGGAENITPKEVWERLKSDFGRLLKSTLLVGAIFIAAIVVFALAIGLIIAMADSGGGSFGGIIGMLILMPILMLGLFYVIIRVILVFPLNIFEKLGARAALKRSFYLTKGAFWRTFGIIFLMYTVQMMIGYAILIPQMVLGVGIGLGTSSGEIENENTMALIMAISYGLYFLVSFALSSLTIVAVGLQYFSLVEEKEHSGLMDRISEIGQSPSQLDSSLETY
jgi:hypothetical protein